LPFKTLIQRNSAASYKAGFANWNRKPEQRERSKKRRQHQNRKSQAGREVSKRDKIQIPSSPVQISEFSCDFCSRSKNAADTVL